MKNDLVYLRHMLDAINQIEKYVSVGHETFMSEPHWQDAAVRQLEIIGEAAKRLSNQFRSQHANIPWKRMSGLRDVLIHNYMGVDLSAVWEITQKNLPDVKKQIQQIINDA